MSARFNYAESRVNKGKAFVDVDEREVIAHFPSLKEPISVPVHLIARVVQVTAVETSSARYRGAPKALRLSARALDANVALVVRQPLRVAKFKPGSESVIPITKRQRAKGMDFQVLGFTVADPAGLVAAIAALGVPVDTSLPHALEEVFGLASPAEVAVIEAQQRKARLKGRALAAVAGIAMIPAYALRLTVTDDGGPFPWHDFWSLVVGGAVFAVLTVTTIAWWPVTPKPAGPRPVRVQVTGARRWMGLATLATMAAIFGLSVIARQIFDVPRAIAFAPLIGLASGFILGFLARSIRLTRRSVGDGGTPAPAPAESRGPVDGWPVA